MKRVFLIVISLLLSVVFVFAIIGCGNTANTEEKGETPPTETITKTGDENETAVYYTVSFNTDGGTEIASQMVKEGGKAIKPKDPFKARDGNTVYSFSGWYVGENEYDFNSVINGDIIISAKWEIQNWSEIVIK